MRNLLLVTGFAALLAGAALFTPSETQAASCCGGSSASSLVVPKFARAIVDISTDLEIYDGYWNQKGDYTSDPPGSDLRCRYRGVNPLLHPTKPKQASGYRTHRE
jgi:hypothetical protein